MMELYANGLHFLGNDEESQREDLCIHGGVFLKVNDTVVSELKKDGSWCVSASALRFLRSLFRSVFFGTEEHMIPCCGHFMIASEDKKRVTIIGCNNGIDFDVIHENHEVIIRLEDGMEQRVPYSEYREAVLAFALQIKDFFDKSPARIFTDDFERDGFEAFQTEFSELLDRAINDPKHIVNVETRF